MQNISQHIGPISRRQSAEMLAVTPNTIRRHEKASQLTAIGLNNRVKTPLKVKFFARVLASSFFCDAAPEMQRNYSGYTGSDSRRLLGTTTRTMSHRKNAGRFMVITLNNRFEQIDQLIVPASTGTAALSGPGNLAPLKVKNMGRVPAPFYI